MNLTPSTLYYATPLRVTAQLVICDLLQAVIQNTKTRHSLVYSTQIRYEVQESYNYLYCKSRGYYMRGKPDSFWNLCTACSKQREVAADIKHTVFCHTWQND